MDLDPVKIPSRALHPPGICRIAPQNIAFCAGIFGAFRCPASRPVDPPHRSRSPNRQRRVWARGPERHLWSVKNRMLIRSIPIYGTETIDPDGHSSIRAEKPTDSGEVDGRRIVGSVVDWRLQVGVQCHHGIVLAAVEGVDGPGGLVELIAGQTPEQTHPFRHEGIIKVVKIFPKILIFVKSHFTVFSKCHPWTLVLTL